jgi:hypothetical protein
MIRALGVPSEYVANTLFKALSSVMIAMALHDLFKTKTFLFANTKASLSGYLSIFYFIFTQVFDKFKRIRLQAF